MVLGLVLLGIWYLGLKEQGGSQIPSDDSSTIWSNLDDSSTKENDNHATTHENCEIPMYSILKRSKHVQRMMFLASSTRNLQMKKPPKKRTHAQRMRCLASSTRSLQGMWISPKRSMVLQRMRCLASSTRSLSKTSQPPTRMSNTIQRTRYLTTSGRLMIIISTASLWMCLHLKLLH